MGVEETSAPALEQKGDRSFHPPWSKLTPSSEIGEPKGKGETHRVTKPMTTFYCPQLSGAAVSLEVTCPTASTTPNTSIEHRNAFIGEQEHIQRC